MLATTVQPPVLGIVVPCYNEEEVLPETVRRLTDVLDRLVREKLVAAGSFMLFVDDGSRDRTWELIESYRRTNPRVAGLKLARNAGHQSALLAGLHRARLTADCAVSIDADLQDDPEAIREFVVKYREGFDIVYGIRQSRATDTAFKRGTAQMFYKLLSRLGAKIEYNHADYRLMSRRALDQLERFKEVNLFLRGIVPMIGFKSARVYFDRHERFAGESKYPLKKMLSFAWDGITSLSVTPIRLVTAAGFALFLLSVIAGLYAVVQKLAGNTVTGWASLMVSVWFVGGIQLISLGLIGEYIGKIYKEVKRRPLYIIEKDARAEAESGNGAAADGDGFRDESAEGAGRVLGREYGR
ncbi:glycosyltransferase family 2 protein [Paenibacillus flagellatus]|uniref:Glycosyltransferase n=1 Tax=Paenibacillus flagellatus TaxID=2211139 RepID=A0A2V5L390_9BACL|nr:glycosyltransferase family 2 protein [Paenibacillus flagellatus]PYI57266.1 glycosyltransferase [Paenibacillus flagellatus]